MNPISGMLAEAKLAYSVVPTLLKIRGNVGSHLSDIEDKFQKLVASLEKAFDDFKHLDVSSASADLGAAWAAGMAIYDDIGLPRDKVTSIVSGLNDIPAVGTLEKAIAAATGIAKTLGLPA